MIILYVATMTTFVTLDNLRVGIREWKARPHWAQDFHSSLYANLEQSRRADPTLEQWWESAVIALGQWKALRSPVREKNTRKAIYQRGLRKLPDIRAQYDAICTAHAGSAPDLEQTCWDELRPLMRLAKKVKIAQSWMFASKFCHFLLPNCVIVTDSQIAPLHGASYKNYWRACQQAWKTCDAHEPLIAELRSAIRGTPPSTYPWATKITELCYAGARG
ncbi:hypothetical protein [Candidatus Viridilinea mediisalina]|uniref:Uncharacterized protein n=1 Tax=Candidatus Viridilinea mediisalina TaxID=2024553 RepID=A0A2A6RPP9_9CHLR|nr:hypothetical protein [Candidatus Viridilinea mediisalina]PDW05094.1 hypothetical protein CJ255_00435 [Candidatus Viridilinea mediisalina]